MKLVILEKKSWSIGRVSPALRSLLLLGLLYLFFVSISLMSGAFKFFGKDFAEQLVNTTANPFVGMLIGILATSLVQSSSTTTTMTVALVASGSVSLAGAIPIIMGANMGTSVTNTLVSMAHISRVDEFKKAFAASTVHDFFNIFSIIILFPLQLAFDLLGRCAGFLAAQFQNLGGLTFANPLKTVTAPMVDFIAGSLGYSGWAILFVAIIFLFVSLRYIVVNLKVLVIGRVEAFFGETLFKNAARAMFIGLIITIMVQSSSVTTSLVVPLAGAGILSLRQIFPFTLGANLGTTVTAILAALITNDINSVTVAFAHLLFNMFGIILIWPVRSLPVELSKILAEVSVKHRFIPILYISVVFFVIPICLIYLLR